MAVAASPIRKLTQEELDAYERDGVIMVKGLVDKNWLEMIENGINEALNNASLYGRYVSRIADGYNMDSYLWKHTESIRDLIYYSPFAYWAQQLMGSEEVRFFYDQMFVKEPGVDAPTPWHQDLSFWPLKGNQICSFWIPLDNVTQENSALQYVKGSHKWSARYRPVSPGADPIGMDSDLEVAPDIHAEIEKYDHVCWDMEPGDVTMFHPLTLHGSSGNKTRKHRRRALALRWVGDDVVYAPENTAIPLPYKYNGQAGKQVSGPLFPRILPSHVPTERAHRAKGVESQFHLGSLKTLLKSRVSAAKLKLKGVNKEAFKETW
ncbi:phytanoyl-CoA dioxygenase family protein [Maricurvus nonylphenolicus]|uniref:phytanoyl-CoA dioxygenase family protein n=1 Tax=Maricurvus nonylphenolicus TaxID=1008307 RepID=UPI0036F247CE